MKGEPSQRLAIAYPDSDGLIDWAVDRETLVRPAAGVLSLLDHAHQVRLSCRHVHLRERLSAEQQNHSRCSCWGEGDRGEENVGWYVCEDHGVDEADPFGDPCGDQKGGCRYYLGG